MRHFGLGCVVFDQLGTAIIFPYKNNATITAEPKHFSHAFFGVGPWRLRPIPTNLPHSRAPFRGAISLFVVKSLTHVDTVADRVSAGELLQYQRSLKERIFHALLFEGLGILFATPLAMWITGKSAVSMAALSAVISAIAMLWNMLFNWLFDRLQLRYGFRRGFWMRILHTCAFEIGLILIVVPLVAWWVDTTLWHALVLDIGLVLFFMPYAFFYNLGYDHIRARMVRARELKG
ncbi:PACE efflux transporter [Paenalcaligenes niemegkensis]|uniref:PACE efflux transporter n=1 Tax=Paenalcaligenes niemegkensis TaxID=2895469 RepID=UPI001EE7D9CD|nr:PACE efflux transporter [Paenalcaligenes niemegkensis]MCQ9616666.1 PACE efflux transporter [Paenalcaligenes niemegkensis]